MIRPEECPECGNTHIYSSVGAGRLHRYYCANTDVCDWESPLFAPEKRWEPQTTKNVTWGHSHGHYYELYDQYGYISTSSKSFPSAELCELAAREERDRLLGRPGYETVTVILWPRLNTVVGRILE